MSEYDDMTMMEEVGMYGDDYVLRSTVDNEVSCLRAERDGARRQMADAMREMDMAKAELTRLRTALDDAAKWCDEGADEARAKFDASNNPATAYKCRGRHDGLRDCASHLRTLMEKKT